MRGSLHIHPGLARHFKTNAELWLNLQNFYDLENDHAVEPVLSKADGRPRTAGNCGTGTGQPAIRSADRQATRFGEAEPDTIGRAGGDERAKDFGNGK